MAKFFYLKERHNPQFDAPYYIMEGQLTKRDAIKKTKTIYGWNAMIPYENEILYKEAIDKLKEEGFSVQ
jgi:hypothetical protein